MVVSCGKTGSAAAVDGFFEALQEQNFTEAGNYLGDADAYSDAIEMQQESGSYLQDTINQSFLDFVYGNLSYTVSSVSEQENTSEITLEITAYNIDGILAAQENAVDDYLASDEYTTLSAGEQYVALCSFIEDFYGQELYDWIQPVTQEVAVILQKTDDQWVIVPSSDLFYAIAGGASGQ
jgi:hypothetical protein